MNWWRGGGEQWHGNGDEFFFGVVVAIPIRSLKQSIDWNGTFGRIGMGGQVARMCGGGF